MRFMMLMIPEVYQPGKTLPENFVPDTEAVEKMKHFNEALASAGALISLDGLMPITAGARIAFNGEEPVVTDGPHIETKEVIGGYWVIRADSLEEAVSWAKKCPAGKGDAIELRRLFDMSDFPDDVQAAADSEVVRAQIEPTARQ